MPEFDDIMRAEFGAETFAEMVAADFSAADESGMSDRAHAGAIQDIRRTNRWYRRALRDARMTVTIAMRGHV